MSSARTYNAAPGRDTRLRIADTATDALTLLSGQNWDRVRSALNRVGRGDVDVRSIGTLEPGTADLYSIHIGSHELMVRVERDHVLLTAVRELPAPRTTAQIDDLFGWVSILVPTRVATEVLGDGMELLARHEAAGASRLRLWVGAFFLTYWALHYAVLELMPFRAGLPKPK